MNAPVNLLSDPLDHYLIQRFGSVTGIRKRRKWLYRLLPTMLSRCAALVDTKLASRQTILVEHQCLLCIKQAIVERGIPGTKEEMYSVVDTSFILDSIDYFAMGNTNS